MDDQRCPLDDGQAGAAEATAAPTLEDRIAQPSMTASPQTEEFFDLIASSQSRRLDDQRASVGSLPGLRITHSNAGHLRGHGEPQEPGDDFFNMLIKYQRRRNRGLGPGIRPAASKPAPPKRPRVPRPHACLCQLPSLLLQALQRSPDAPLAPWPARWSRRGPRGRPPDPRGSPGERHSSGSAS
nr:G-protein-signaling modulator 1 isoform X1 [Macaca nemestrina]